MTDQTIRIVLTGDSAGLTSAANSGAQALDKFNQKAGQAAQGYKAIGQSGEFAAWQLRQVGPQITDIVTGLATGQKPLTVFLQQGGQLKDMFGGWSAAGRAVVQSLGATTLAVGIGAAGIAALAHAWMEGAAQSQAFRDSVALTGNAAGLTEGAFNALIQRVSTASGATVSASREIAQGLLQSGKVGGPALEVISTAAARLAEVSGRSSEQVVGDLLSMSNGVADWAGKNNEQYHFVTAAQLEHIRTLEEQGNKQAAMIETGQALIDHLAQQGQSLGYLERMLKAAKSAWSGFWDAAYSVGRTATVEDRIASLREQISSIEKDWTGLYRGNELAKLRGELQNLLSDQLKGANRAADQGAADQEEQDKIERRKKLRQVTEALAGANTEYTKTVNALARSYAAGDKGVETYEKYQQLVLEARKKYNPTGESRSTSDAAAIKAAAERVVAAYQAATDEQRAADAARTTVAGMIERLSNDAEAAPDTFQGKVAAQAAAIFQRQEQQYQRQVKSITSSRAESLAQIEAAGAEAANKAASLNMYGASDVNYRQQAADFVIQLKEQTAQITANLITDDRLRATTLLEIERKSAQDRIDLWEGYGINVEDAQKALNASIVAKHAALDEQLKPGYQRLIDEWQRTTDVITKTYDEGITNMLQQSSQAFGQWATGQSVSLKSLVLQWEATLAQGLFKTAIGSLLSSAGTNFFGDLAGINFGVNAKGGVYQSPSLHSYANSVVSRPTMFAFAQGIGLMGEAGPEAIMPLKRTASGSLGVVASGAAAGNSLSVSMPLSVQIDARTDQAQVYDLVRRAVAEGNTALLTYLKDKGWIR